VNRYSYYMTIFIITGFLLAGCRLFDHIKPKITNPNNPIKHVAILPLQNDTSDIEAPEFIRKKLSEALKNKQYNVKPTEEVDRLLRDKMGATLGGQLQHVKPQKLKEVLEVEGVVMGTLMDFNETTTGVYNVRKVRGKFKLLNCMTGKTFWENGIGVKSQDSTGDLAGAATSFAAELKDSDDKDVPWVTMENETSNYSAGENFVMSLGKKLFSKATNSHLEDETQEMIKRITSTLPTGPGI
jgi:hypothetical protein